MRSRHSEVTGSAIDEEWSIHHNDTQGYWPLSVFAAQREFGCRTATTGQMLVLVRYEVDGPSGPVFLHIDVPKVAASPAVVLEAVRNAFAMNISEAAEAFGITRQTAYQWLKLTDMEQVRSRENRERLKQLYAAALTWKELPPLTGRWLHALLPSGQTLLDLLKVAKIDANTLRSAHAALASSSHKRRIEEGERATQAVASFATAFANLSSGPKGPKGAA
jgi:DNA-binding transcriptional ArsR family regulator